MCTQEHLMTRNASHNTVGMATYPLSGMVSSGGAPNVSGGPEVGVCWPPLGRGEMGSGTGAGNTCRVVEGVVSW